MSSSVTGNGTTPPPLSTPKSIAELLAQLYDVSVALVDFRLVGSLIFLALGYYLFNKLRGDHRALPRNIITHVKSLTVIVSLPREPLLDALMRTSTQTAKPKLKVYSKWYIELEPGARFEGSSLLNLAAARVASRLATIYRLWLPASSRSAFYASVLVYIILMFFILALQNQQFPPDARIMRFAWLVSLGVLLLPAGLLWFFNFSWSGEQADLEAVLEDVGRMKEREKEDSNSLFVDNDEK